MNFTLRKHPTRITNPKRNFFGPDESDFFVSSKNAKITVVNIFQFLEIIFEQKLF